MLRIVRLLNKQQKQFRVRTTTTSQVKAHQKSKKTKKTQKENNNEGGVVKTTKSKSRRNSKSREEKSIFHANADKTQRLFSCKWVCPYGCVTVWVCSYVCLCTFLVFFLVERVINARTHLQILFATPLTRLLCSRLRLLHVWPPRLHRALLLAKSALI